MSREELKYSRLGEEEKGFEENWPAAKEALYGIVEDCQLEESVKFKIKEALADLENISQWDNPIEAIRGTISRIVDITHGYRESPDQGVKKEAIATFENLRAGLWELLDKKTKE